MMAGSRGRDGPGRRSAAGGTALFVSAVVLASGAWPTRLSSQVDRTKPPTLAPPPALKVPALETTTLANGLLLAVVEMHKVPVVDVQVLVDAGAARDPEDLPGLATFTAAMLQQGAGKRAALEIADETAFLGAQLSTAAIADRATASLHVSKRRLAPALDLLADVLLQPTFPDSEVTRQRELRRAELVQQRDEPVAVANIAFPAIVYGRGHPYGHPVNGTDAATAGLTRDRVTAFYRAFYRPNATRILIVGDVTPADARRLVAARFGAWERAEVAAVPVAPTPALVARTVYLIDKPGAAQSVIRIGHVGPPRSSPDWVALEVLNTILGGAFTSRLNQNLRETHGYTYGAFSQFLPRRLTGAFVALASVVTGKTDSSLIQFLQELRRIRDEAVPSAELAKAKAYLSLGLPGDFETTASAAARFRELLAFGLPLDYFDHYVAQIDAVSAAAVQRVARQYIDPDHFAIVVVGDKSQIEAGITALNQGPVRYRDIWGQEIP